MRERNEKNNVGGSAMIVGIGSDIIDIRRLEKIAKQFGKKFESRVFTAAEIARADARGRRGSKERNAILAKRFAAKEACAKALGTGIGQGANWKDISVSNAKNGAPRLALSGAAAKKLKKLIPVNMKAELHVSLSDDYPLAQAFVVISAVDL